MALNSNLDDLGALLLYNIEAMKSVCEAETEALKKRSREGFFALQPKKVQATEALQYALTSWQRIPDTNPQKAEWQLKIKDAYDGFRNIAAVNQNHLIAMRRSLNRMQLRLIDAAKQALTGGTDVYNKGGRKANEKAKILSASLSETA